MLEIKCKDTTHKHCVTPMYEAVCLHFENTGHSVAVEMSYDEAVWLKKELEHCISQLEWRRKCPPSRESDDEE